jgi:hypothetical protein
MVKLKPEHKKAIAEDFGFAVRMMKESQNYDAKLFYFSSTFGVLSRIFNINFDPQLVFVHQILAAAHGTILGRLAALKGGEQSIMLDDGLFDKLSQATEELAERIREDKDSSDVLQRIALLTFAVTGNGYYLWKKGAFSV